MRVWFDTEFSSLTASAELISAGFVTERGAEFYAELPFNKGVCSAFVKETVLPLLDARPDQRMSSGIFVQRLADWLAEQGEGLVLVSDSQWDLQVLRPAVLPFGGFDVLGADLRYQMIGFDDDCAARRFRDGFADYFQRQPGKQHHALHDARALKQAHLRAEGHY